jgi:hypothetical protein
MKRLLYYLMIAVVILIGFTCKSTTEPEFPETTLKVTSPNGGENFMVGLSQDITWTSNTKSKLKIEYTTNYGSAWVSIANGIDNNGSYPWIIPNTISDLCKIKITALDSLSLSDESDNVFSIIQSNIKRLSIVSPNGGEVLAVGNKYEIKWNSTGITNVRLEFSTNNGSLWNLITAGTPADSAKFEWAPIPNFPSTQCLLKISDTSTDTLWDISNTVFTITMAQTLRVTSPVGNEVWASNSSQIVTWYSQQVSDVKIEYTVNNGVNWSLITGSTPSNGYYVWNPVPAIYSTNAKIRISDVADGYPTDESDTVFTITPQPSISVISPNGGEYWLSGVSNYIQWTSTGGSDVPSSIKANKKSNLKEGTKFFNTIKNSKISIDDLGKSGFISISTTGTSIENVKIEFSSNNGATWNTITTSTPNNGFYQWDNVPVVNSSLCKIRISDAVDGNPADESDNAFVIYDQVPQNINITSPDGGEMWEAGTSQSITWNSSGVAAVKIEYTTNNGVDWNTIIESTPSDGFYTWSPVPNFASTNCKIRISDASDRYPTDESSAVFSISPEPEITVITPNGGESWLTGTNNIITWTSTNIANVKIEFTTNSGASWTLIKESTPSDGVYEWNGIPDLNSNLCRVRISDADDGVPFDISDKNFTIYNQVVQQIKLTSPVGGENWQAGTSQNITWNASGITNVKIEYTTDGGQEWNTIANNIKSTGAYGWNLPNISSTQCKVRISDAADGQPSVESNAPFSIKPVPMIKIISPNGGEIWTAGKVDTIRWTSVGVENVMIERTTDNGETWNTIVGSTPSSGIYPVSFSVPTKFYKVRISESITGSPTDESDGTFTVNEAPQITVVAPNGGEDWLLNSIGTIPIHPIYHEIRWISTNIDSVKIEYTIDNGFHWFIVINSTPSNGIYNWKMPDIIDYRSDLCKVRISTTNDLYSDMSDGLFSLHPEPKLLRLTFPNGGEQIYKHINHPDTLITWVSTGISNVNIWLSLDNGISWNSIANNIQSTGAYRWNLPGSETVSSLVRIKVEDASDPDNYNDMSDSYFSLNDYPGLSIFKPSNNNSTIKQGSNFNISWVSNKNIKSVYIEFSADNGKTWQKIADNVSSKSKQMNDYLWHVNQVNSGKILLRITDTDGKFSAATKSIKIKN